MSVTLVQPPKVLLNYSNFPIWARLVKFNLCVVGLDFDELLRLSPRKKVLSRDTKECSIVDLEILVYIIRSLDECFVAEYSDLAVYGSFGLLWDAISTRFGGKNPQVVENFLTFCV